MGDCNNKTNINNENPNIELFMTILVNIGNILSVIYNIPQMWRTHKLKKADDISSHFLWMRLSAGIIWSIYCIYYRMWYVIISWTTTIISTTQILYYKYYPSHLAPVLLIEEQKQQQQQQDEGGQDQYGREEEERIEMQSLQKKENGYYADIIPLN
jgi:uncharacterized protein with PQ loop repeat